MRIFYDPSVVFQPLMPNYFWRTSNDKILVTFDDGPQNGATDIALRSLSEHKISALFFLSGINFDKNLNLAKEILAENHHIGLHMINHNLLLLKTRKAISEEISIQKKTIEEKLGYVPKYFRPPHGVFTPGLNEILSTHHLKNVIWSLLTKDYNNDLKVVKFALEKYLRNNSIVVFHDRLENRNIIKDSINNLIEQTHKKNFTIGDAPECLK